MVVSLDVNPGDELVKLTEVQAAAQKLGCEIKIKATGPAYRIELLWERGKELPSPRYQTLGYQDDEPPPPELLGYSDGITQPNGVTHLESIEVRKYTGFFARRREAGLKRYKETLKINPGLLLSLATACWIREVGPFKNAKAQLLCIRDDEKQHRKLVKFYKLLGFRPLREVGYDMKSFSDRLFWGGEGTIMEITIDNMRKNLGARIRKILAK